MIWTSLPNEKTLLAALMPLEVEHRLDEACCVLV